MKKGILLLLAIVIIFSCKSVPIKKVDTPTIKKEVTIFLDDWHKAASEANYMGYFGKMDSVSVFIGTDASENWNKTQFSAFSKPYFDKGKAWSFKALERNIYTSKTGDFVWFDELLDTWMGTCRGSGVLEKVKDNWTIKHYVLSVSIPNDDIQAVILAKKKNDAIFLRKFKN